MLGFLTRSYELEQAGNQLTEVYIMDIDWINDGRKIPDEVMFYISRMAVNAVRVLERVKKPNILILLVFYYDS